MPFAADIYYTSFIGGEKRVPPVLLVHGAGSNHLAWPAVFRRLDGYRVLSVDLPGHGRSAGVGYQKLEKYAQDLLHFLQQVRIYRAVVIGYSMGGAIALEMARRDPEVVAGLGLIASGAYLEVDPELLALLSRPVSLPIALQRLSQRLFAPGTDPNFIKRMMTPIMAARPGMLYNDWLACARFDLRQKMLQITAPAWIASGREDQLVPVAQAHFLAANLPGSSLQILSKAGHMVILEQPKLLAEGLYRFLGHLFSE